MLKAQKQPSRMRRQYLVGTFLDSSASGILQFATCMLPDEASLCFINPSWKVGRRQYHAGRSPLWGAQQNEKHPNAQRFAFGVLDLEMLENNAEGSAHVVGQCGQLAEASSSQGARAAVDNRQGRLCVALLRIASGGAARSAGCGSDAHVIPRRTREIRRVELSPADATCARRFGSTRHGRGNTDMDATDGHYGESAHAA